MKHKLLLFAAALGLALSSCSRYHEDLSYSQKIQTQTAIHSSTPVVAAESPSLSTPVIAGTSVSQPAAVKPVAASASVKFSALRHALVKVKPVVTALQVNASNAHNKVTMGVKKRFGTKAFITGNGLFMLLLSMFVIAAGAIILFMGTSSALPMITIAGLVVMIGGVLLFGASAAYIIDRNGKA
jgi:hypothetical protein